MDHSSWKASQSPLLIITGEIGTGKTLLCRLLAEAARQAQWQVSGLLSPGRFADGHKVGIDVVDLRQGKTYPLAELARPGEGGEATPRWRFDPQRLDWGNQVLQNALPTGLLVVDELGPLELKFGQGWQAGIEVLDRPGDYRLALAVIRPSLLAYGRQRWPQARTVTLLAPQQALYLAAELGREFIQAGKTSQG